MSWIKHTGCTYHNQDTGYYCGAAADMMVLAEIGVPYSQLDQNDLYSSNHNHNQQPNWYSDPYGIRWTMNNRKPPGALGFVVYKPTTYEEGTRKIIDTIYEYNVAPIALVYGCMHWIVVAGVQTNVEPITDNYILEGFWIHNPVYHSPAPPPPHSASDGCGSGGITGTANEFVSQSYWEGNLFTGCNYDDPNGNLQYVSICDPKPPRVPPPLPEGIRFKGLPDRLLDPEQVISLSTASMERYRLDKDERVAPILQKDRVGEPQLVLRLDQPNTYYYILPWTTKEGATSLTAQIDARSGAFNSLQLREKSKSREFLSKKQAIARVEKQRFTMLKRRRTIVFYPGVTQPVPTLVWRPCWESWSPHLPFYQFTLGSDTVYVRVDGQVFTELTTKGRGA
ncbi:MAG: hypothetical protein HXS41_15245 [Theionarchaea archaeon]|nr:hypothetical protein [Theionarchaea archaeon]MBU7022406.1 hypothetical protein [Theionarchaea archaeon]MBU7035851.1 hypothetical protein [Theionarchaea archaeon]